jgi:CDP-diacylglycerol--glycerol-3-phosphate 3-phosphatidyltransferase
MGTVFEAARGIYERTLSWAAAAVAKTGVRPNTLTWLSLVPALLAGIAAAASMFLPAAILLLLSGVFDLLDGALARSTGQETRFGALLDSTLDRLSDAAVPAGLALIYAPHGVLVLVPVLMIAGGFLVSYVRARAEGLGLDLPRLWGRREDRMGIMVAGLVFAPLPIPGMAVPAPALLLVVGFLALLSFAAAIAALAASRNA